MTARDLILVVDAAGQKAASLKNGLPENIVDITIAPDGFKALAICKLRSPDIVVFIDCQKEMLARDFYARLQSDAQTRTIPVILVGQEFMANDKVICFPANTDDSLIASAIKLLSRERRFAAEVRENEAKLKDMQLTEKNTAFKQQRYIREFINLEILCCRRYGLPMSLIMLLPDRAGLEKSIGSPVDKESLYEHLAGIIYKICRISDQVIRLPNDELAIFLPATSLDGAVDLAERLRSTLEGCTFLFNGLSSFVTASLGVSMLGEDEVDSRKLMAYAQSALYKAVQDGGNVTMVAEQEIN